MSEGAARRVVVTTEERGARGGSRGAAVTVIAIVAVIAALYLGQVVLIPVALGLVLTALLVPVVGRLRRWHVPAPLGAAVAVLGSLAIIVGAGMALEPPVRGLAAEVPKGVAAARAKLTRFREPLARVGIHVAPAGGKQGMAAPAAPATGGGARRDSGAAAPRDSASRPTPAADSSSGARDAGSRSVGRVGSTESGGESGGSGNAAGNTASRALSAAGRVFGVTAELLAELVEELLLAFFLLAAGAAWGDKLRDAVRDPVRECETLAAIREVRHVVTRYLLVTAMINAAQGTLVGLAMWWLGLPSPALWGVLTFIAEFVPYLGGFVMVALLLVVGFASGASIGHALLAPLSYLAITTIQNNVVSPALYGKGLRLNPTAILLSVMFWYALWGVAGAFLAVPILAAFKVVASHVRPLEPLCVFLAE